MKLYSQCDPAWGSHPLGTINPGTECQYGCLNTVLAMIANDSGHTCNPDTLCALFNSKGIFLKDSTGTLDLLPNNALDLAFPGDYVTTHYSGLRADILDAALPTPDTYTFLWLSGVYSPYWGMVISTHFVLAWGKDGSTIGDPEGAVVRAISAYGGTTAIKGTTTVKRIHPAPPVVVPPVPVPIPIPIPLFTWKATDGTRSPSAAILATTTADALKYAQSVPGITVYINDVNGNAVATEYVAPAPAPIPIPTPVAPTPPPDVKGSTTNFSLQGLIIFLINFWLKLQGKR